MDALLFDAYSMTPVWRSRRSQLVAVCRGTPKWSATWMVLRESFHAATTSACSGIRR
ncbi:hypothetical protein GCM10009558_085110 [Virgisporangium aurantiacum]